MKLVLLTVVGLAMTVVPTMVAKGPIGGNTDNCRNVPGGFICCDYTGHNCIFFFGN